MPPIIFITGTDTGAGKTVLTALLAAHLRSQKIRVAAFKPVCSGGRDDAKKIFAALGGALTLDEINPWHFRAAIAPVLAAKLEKKSVTLAQVLAHLRDHLLRKFCSTVIHRQHNMGEVETGIEITADQLYVFEQRRQSLQRVVLALDRNK